MFLREMDPPLITKDVRDQLHNLVIHNSEDLSISSLALSIRQLLELLDPLAYTILRYLVLHLRRVAEVEGKVYYAYT